jgi:glutathione S-transferase
MILYYAPTACSIAPHIALEEIGADFEPRRLDLAAGEQGSPEYLKVNPAGRVPVLIVEGRTITEVPALLTYIAGLDREAGLIPRPGTLDHARCFEWLGFLSSTLHVSYAQFRRPLRFVGEDFACLDAFAAEGRERTIAYYREVERRLAAGEWAAGGAYSIADIYLFPFFTWAWRLEFDITGECPNWAALFERTKARPAVQRAVEREGLVL